MELTSYIFEAIRPLFKFRKSAIFFIPKWYHKVLSSWDISGNGTEPN